MKTLIDALQKALDKRDPSWVYVLVEREVVELAVSTLKNERLGENAKKHVKRAAASLRAVKCPAFLKAQEDKAERKRSKKRHRP